MENIFLNTLFGKACDRPPVWLMRQAGRVLPRYQQLREQYSFSELIGTPELAAKVTLLPVEDLGVDAAILFSDILTVPMAMGMEIEWTERGPRFLNPLAEQKHPLDNLTIQPERLNYVYEAIDKVVEQSHVPLIGFCGAPLTMLCYMLQGISTKQTFPEAKRFFYKNRKETKRLLDAVTDLSIEYATKQIEHGVDAFQLFDSIDWQTSLFEARWMVHPEVGLQGNIDPHLLFASQDEIAQTMEGYKSFFREHPHWVVNLGHGVLADTPFEHVKFLVNWIKETNWQ